MLQRLDQWLKKSKWRWLLLIVSALFVFWLFFMGSVTLMDYSESVAFCTACHTMDPEHMAYMSSPHAKVDCGTCHIGPGAYHAFEAKVRSAHYVWSYPLGLYEKPIPSPITSMRPAEVVCEQCHWPQKVYADRVETIPSYAPDATNSLTQTVLVLNTGGGSTELGQGRGIHWHIDNPVYYIATDEKRQDIPWVQATFNGITTTYVSTDSNLTPEAIAKAEKRKMDCIDCHNRASHNFRNPDDALDQAMALGQIPTDLPYIKREGANVLMKKYATEAEAAKAIAAVEDFYKTSYPDLYASRKADVQKAVAGLQTIFNNTQFPFMNVDWQSHTNNIGHENFPGCFRCHDGKHLSQDNQAIRLECNLCHSIPLVADPGKPIPPIEVSAAKEPTTHKSTTWLAEHRYKFDASCAQCHTVDNPGGKDDSSFCSNSACHANKWVYAGLDAPKVRQLSAPPKVPGTGAPKPIPHPVGQRTDCLTCHAAGKVKPYPENHASFKIDMCTQCHKPTLQETVVPAAAPAATAAPTSTRPAVATAAAATAAPTPTAAAAATQAPQATVTSASAGGPPAIPHVIDDPVHKDCTLCHGQGKIKPFPANHTSFTVDMCTKCHQPAQQSGAGSAATVVPTSTVETTGTTVPAATTAPTAAAATPTAAAAAAPTTAVVPAGGPPAIPHDLAGRDNCLLCHNPNGGVKPAPQDHVGRTSEQCQACHKPKN
jgi:nitrate/TMAO reductase-like tetraheme cytochrome c subunit